jgi:hypothetical protein
LTLSWFTGQVFFVDCQLDNSEQKKLLSKQQINAGIESQLQKLGASVSQSLNKKVRLRFCIIIFLIFNCF